MKKNYSLLLILFVFITNIFSAQTYYYYKGQKQILTLDKSGFDIFVDDNFQIGNSNTNLESFSLTSINTNENFATVEFVNNPTDTEYYSKINELKSNANLLSVQPRFVSSDDIVLRLSNYLFVKLKNIIDISILQNFANSKNFTIVGPNQFMPLWYKLKCDKNTLGNSLEIANYLYETGYFAAAQPDFLSNYEEETEPQSLVVNNPTQNPNMTICANDTNFGEQWGLQNTTNPGIDIDICNAWTITEGAGVKVAVLDTGIDLNNSDLSTNILPQSYDTVTGTSPSQLYTPAHGMPIAGIIGAIKNNNYQVVGVAPQCKLFSISSKLDNRYESDVVQRADGINWAVQKGADIINNSWYFYYPIDFLDDAITNALNNGRSGLGTILIFASGNSNKPENVSSLFVKYPASSDDRIISVGAINNTGTRANFSCYGEQLDVVAPGVNILSTVYNNNISFNNGTSFATPHVAGICALILSVNPCLSVTQVNDIIEKTAKKLNNYTYANTGGRPNGTWNEETGYGLANAYEAVKLAQQMNSSTLDLYIKDSADDFGIEPNTTTPYMWTSDNIWIRNSNDNGTEHQNPEYNSNGTPNYISVRVINKSCVSSNGNDQLKLYWAKASTALSYPNPWLGGVQHPITGANMGNHLGTINIPTLQPGEETILTLPWIVPNPANYGNDGDQWHFCLLARIESTDDPMTVSETTDLNANVRNNNNIAWKNLTVVDLIPNRSMGIVAVGNPSNVAKSYYLEMLVDDLETGNRVYDEAEVSIRMDDVIYAAWERGGGQAQRLSPTLEEKKKIVGGNNVILDNISFNPNETGTLKLDFNFLTQQSSSKTAFRYHIIQKETGTGKIIGGETFVINKNHRALFAANAGENRMVDANDVITLYGENIYEPAIYNWYDSSGNLVFQGQNLQIPNAIAENYRLEVISTLDGFKDYAEVEVRLKPSRIEYIAPNPASSNILVNYKLNGASSAYLMIIGLNGTVSNNYILDINSTQTNINLSSYSSGYYTIALIVNGEIVDTKTLIKQ